MNVDQTAPIRVLYRHYLDGGISFDELMSITDRRLAQFDARYPMPADTRERLAR